MSADAIAIVASNTSWTTEFAAEQKRIRRALGDRALRIDPVGSTSVNAKSSFIRPIIERALASSYPR